jgi:hypothetical protein
MNFGCRISDFGIGLLWALAVVTVGGAAFSDDAGSSRSAPVTVSARVEPQTTRIGTPFRYTLRIEAEQEVELVVPLLAERLGEFTITDFGKADPQRREGRLVMEQWYTLVTYEAGDRLVPGPTIQYRTPGSDMQRLDAPDTLVIVESLLAKAENEKGAGAVALPDIKGPVAVPRDYRVLWWAALALAALAAVAFGLFRLLNRRRQSPTAPPRPAHEVALEALTRLRAARLLEAGKYEEFYVRLSGIVRVYLEGRFGLRAPEMTTEEFLQAAQKNPLLAPQHRSSLSQFLSEADLVKFARHRPASEDAERAFAAARQFVDSTRPPVEAERAAA